MRDMVGSVAAIANCDLNTTIYWERDPEHATPPLVPIRALPPRRLQPPHNSVNNRGLEEIWRGGQKGWALREEMVVPIGGWPDTRDDSSLECERSHYGPFRGPQPMIDGLSIPAASEIWAKWIRLTYNKSQKESSD